MSIHNVSSPASSPPMVSSPATSQPRAASVSPHVSIDSLTQQLQPPRFPWLSRLSSQLEAAAAERKRLFDDAPQLGDHLDEKA